MQVLEQSYHIAKLYRNLLLTFNNLIWRAMEKELIERERSSNIKQLWLISENLEQTGNIASSSYCIKVELYQSNLSVSLNLKPLLLFKESQSAIMMN